MKIETAQSAFVAGELDVSLYSRENLETYAKGLDKARNVYILPQGGAKRREGSQYIDRLTNDAPGRLVPFEFNTEQKYLHVYTAGELKVYKDDELQTVKQTSPLTNLTDSILDEMTWTQSADTLLLFHEDLQTMKITRTSHTAWTAVSQTFSNIPDYDFGSGNEDVISTSRGWPRSGAFKYGRLWLCGLKSRPQTILGSVVGDFFNLNEGTAQPDECINVTIDDDRVNAIRHAFPGRALHVLTSGGEFTIQASLGDAVSPEKIAEQLKKATLHGCNGARPVSVDGATIFVEESGLVVRQFVYNDLEQSYNAPDISNLSPHLVRNVKRMDVRKATENFRADYVYMVNTDGTMAVLNVLRDEQLLAWSLFETDGFYEDVAVVGQDVYVIVQRDINGSVRRYLEKFNPDHLTDCSVRQVSEVYSMGLPWLLTSSAKTSWSGFDHLNGKEVKVLGDDYILNSVTVSNGTVTASESVRELEAGLHFAARVKTLPASIIIAGQTYAARFKRLVYCAMQLIESRGVVVKQANGETYKPAWRQFGAEVLNTAVQLFTGKKKVNLGGYDRDAQVEMTQDDPLEFYVSGITLGIGV